MVLICAVPVHAVIGDLNLDGVVDLVDFFILADNFGREGAPEVCEDTPGDDDGTGAILDAIGDSTTLVLEYPHLLDWQPRRRRAPADCRQAPAV